MKNNLANRVTLVPFEVGEADTLELFSQYEIALRDHIDLAFGWDDAFQRRRFADSYDSSDIVLIRVGAETAGFAVIKTLDDAIHLSLLILKPGYQRQGIGRVILTSLMSTAAQDGKSITLSCFLSNSDAIAFYESMKFKVASIEEHFINYRFSPSPT
jgi:ribosomal protein S18 acetylase RimI-like enzyme